MAEQKEFITEEQSKVIVPIVAGVILLSALGLIVYKTQNELMGVNRQIVTVREKIKLVKTLQVKQQEEKSILKSFPSAEKKNDVIKEIANMARLEGIQVDEIDPKEDQLTGTNFVNLALGIRGSGSYLSVTRFVKRLETGEHFILISRLNLDGFDLKSRPMRRGDSESLFDAHRSIDIIINIFLVEP